MKLRSTLATLLVLVSVLLLAADWPQWRGPNRDGISKETGLLQQWPEGGPKLLWERTDMGDGFSTPSIVGERMYLQSSKGLEDESVHALSSADGKTVWTTRLGSVGENIAGAYYPAARSTPTVDGERLFALGSDGDLACLEAKNGQIVWRKNLRTDFGGQTGAWAYAESPLIDGDKVVCTPGGKEATLVALNKRNGETIWMCAVPGGDKAAYASIVISDAVGVKQYVQLLDKGLVGVDAETGHFLWRYDRVVEGSPANMPTPVARSSRVYAAAAKAGAAVEIKRNDSGLEASELYYGTKWPNAIGGSVELNGYLYGAKGGSLVCADFATGEIKWEEGSVKAGSLLYADGCLYWHGQQNGDLALIAATPDAFHLKGRFTPPDVPAHRAATEKSKDGLAWAYPAVANGRLYVRDWNCLWCYDVKAK